MFKHNFVPIVDLKETMIDGKRYYILPNSPVKFKSVTTVLGEKLDKTKLIEWKERVGPEEAERIASLARGRGNAIHKMAERHLLNQSTKEVMKDVMPFDVPRFDKIRKVLNEHVDTVFGIELPLYSVALKTAGRTDTVATYDNELSIIDFKGSNKKKKEEWIEQYFLQATCYAMMFSWIYKIKVTQIVIVVSVDHELEPQIFIKPISNYVKRVIEIFTKE